MMLKNSKSIKLLLLVFLIILFTVNPVLSAQKAVPPKYDRKTLEKKWKQRIVSFLDKGVIPLIDLESSLMQGFGGEKYLEHTKDIMDEMGVALMALFTFQAPAENQKLKGYRWNYYIHDVVNKYPDYFILSTNGGVNNNWFKQKKSYIQQLSKQVKSGDYPIISEIEFRHYMSDLQCQMKRTDRDHYVPINSKNGHKLFKLSHKTGVPIVIHFELEDELLNSLEEMLSSYPRAKIIIAHFGQIRNHERQQRFDSSLVRYLLRNHPNLYFDLSTGEPGRRYRCTGKLDTVIWEKGILGSQKKILRPEYKAILTDFSNRFVVGFDYGGGQLRKTKSPSTDKLRRRVGNIHLILKDLPIEAKHNISYRNAWLLLTGTEWQ